MVRSLLEPNSRPRKLTIPSTRALRVSSSRSRNVVLIGVSLGMIVETRWVISCFCNLSACGFALAETVQRARGGTIIIIRKSSLINPKCQSKSPAARGQYGTGWVQGEENTSPERHRQRGGQNASLALQAGNRVFLLS